MAYFGFDNAERSNFDRKAKSKAWFANGSQLITEVLYHPPHYYVYVESIFCDPQILIGDFGTHACFRTAGADHAPNTR